MNPMLSYFIVASIILVLAWAAYTQLNQGSRAHHSLIKPINIEDIEINTTTTIGSPTTNSLIAPRVEYSIENTPFPQSENHTLDDNRDEIIVEIDLLKETNIERYSIRQRTKEKVSECEKLTSLIKGLSNKYEIELDEESINAPLEGLTLLELDVRQSSLLELYDHLYQLSFEEEVQQIRRREIQMKSENAGSNNALVADELNDLTDELELLRNEETLYRDIRSATTLEFLEELDFSNFSDDSKTRIQSHYKFYYSRLSEKIRIENETNNYRNYKDLILNSEDQEELNELKIEGVNNKQLIHLQDILKKRIDILDVRQQQLKEAAMAEEIKLKIESAESTKELDLITITGVNSAQEEELNNLFTITREHLKFNELFAQISYSQYVLELDNLVIQGVSEEHHEELVSLQTKRRSELVEIAKQKKFTAQYNKLLDELPRIDEIDDLLGVEIDNVSESQKQELEALRLSRLDHLEEIERQRIEREQALQFTNLRKQIESSKTTAEIDVIVIEGVSDEQSEELTEIKDEVREIIAEDEAITEKVNKAEKRRKKVPEPGKFSIEPESEFRTRSKSYEALDGLLRFSLCWNNMNDLDLIVKTPKGEIIHRGKRKSSSGGRLDLEMNSQPQSKSALENIVWPKNKNPPPGIYKVFAWHRKRHQKLRKSDPTDYTLRVRVGADYFQYIGQTSYGDKLLQIAKIEVPTKNELMERLESESETYRNQRSDILAAQNENDIPEIDTNNSDIHVIMLERLIEKQKAQLEEKKQKAYLAKQKERYAKTMASIQSAQNIDELLEIRYDDLPEKAQKSVEKELMKRKKIIESGIMKKEQKEQLLLFEGQRAEINNSKSITELSSIIFDDNLTEKQMASLQKIKQAKRKFLLSTMNADELEQEKQSRLHQALNQSYKRGGLQPLNSDETIPNEFKERLKTHSGKSGEPQVSILWNNKNDLNLLVVTPKKEVIHPRNPKSSEGGTLDIEMNKKGETSTPIENIYWKKGNAIKGTYYIYVHFFKEHSLFKKTNLSECRIQVSNKGKITEYLAQLSTTNKLQFIAQMKVD